MRKAFVFIATFVAVLIAGAAFAYMVSPGEAVIAGEEDELHETTTTSTLHVKEEPSGDSVSDVDDKDDAIEEKESPKDEERDEPASPPEIVILHPEEGAHFSEKHLVFEGEVSPGSKVFAAGYEADVSEDGHWRIVLILSPGGNLATFTAVNDGLESTAQVKVYFDAEEKPEPKEEPSDHEFSAHQKYGSCGEETPYDIFYGTGEPGTKIWIGSDFGTNNTVIGESGKWELKVEFPGAPCNDDFRVVLETDKGHRKVFEFLRTCEDGGGEDHPVGGE